MFRTAIRCLISVLSAGLLAACSPTPNDAGYGDVRSLVFSRTGLTLQWNAREADAKAAGAVDQLLAHDLTAGRAAQIALLNNRHVQADFEDLGMAQADLVQAGLLKNPVFDLGVRFPDRAPAGTYLDIAVTEDLLDVFVLSARKDLAAAQLVEARSKFSHEILGFVAQTMEDFYSYQAGRQIERLSRVTADFAAASLETAERLHAAGNLDDLTLDKFRAEAARARIDAEDAAGAAVGGREKIGRDMGLSDTGTSWTVAPLPDVPAGDFPDADLESLAEHQRQDLAAAKENITVQSRALGLTGDFRFFNQADIGPEFERETDGQWRIGPTISAPLPLFDQGQAKMSRAQASLRQAEQEYLAEIVDVRSEVRVARAMVLTCRAKAMLYRDELIPAERDLVHQTELQYNGMLAGVFQLLQSERERNDAAREMTLAVRDYWIARTELERAIGGRLPSEGAATQPVSGENSW